mmetsp:Transcript_48872/g.114754  ORF Transcript_48872/g.114754 Transcript_48872/m.114754 type:complete len:219 (-) Transcript_48872:302-958(-)
MATVPAHISSSTKNALQRRQHRLRVQPHVIVAVGTCVGRCRRIVRIIFISCVPRHLCTFCRRPSRHKRRHRRQHLVEPCLLRLVPRRISLPPKPSLDDPIQVFLCHMQPRFVVIIGHGLPRHILWSTSTLPHLVQVISHACRLLPSSVPPPRVTPHLYLTPCCLAHLSALLSLQSPSQLGHDTLRCIADRHGCRWREHLPSTRPNTFRTASQHLKTRT